MRVRGLPGKSVRVRAAARARDESGGTANRTRCGPSAWVGCRGTQQHRHGGMGRGAWHVGDDTGGSAEQGESVRTSWWQWEGLEGVAGCKE